MSGRHTLDAGLCRAFLVFTYLLLSLNDVMTLSFFFVAAIAACDKTRSSAIAEGRRDALVSRNPATTKHLI